MRCPHCNTLLTRFVPAMFGRIPLRSHCPECGAALRYDSPCLFWARLIFWLNLACVLGYGTCVLALAPTRVPGFGTYALTTANPEEGLFVCVLVANLGIPGLLLSLLLWYRSSYRAAEQPSAPRPHHRTWFLRVLLALPLLAVVLTCAYWGVFVLNKLSDVLFYDDVALLWHDPPRYPHALPSETTQSQQAFLGMLAPPDTDSLAWGMEAMQCLTADHTPDSCLKPMKWLYGLYEETLPLDAKQLLERYKQLVRTQDFNDLNEAGAPLIFVIENLETEKVSEGIVCGSPNPENFGRFLYTIHEHYLQQLLTSLENAPTPEEASEHTDKLLELDQFWRRISQRTRFAEIWNLAMKIRAATYAGLSMTLTLPHREPASRINEQTRNKLLQIAQPASEEELDWTRIYRSPSFIDTFEIQTRYDKESHYDIRRMVLSKPAPLLELYMRRYTLDLLSERLWFYSELSSMPLPDLKPKFEQLDAFEQALQPGPGYLVNGVGKARLNKRWYDGPTPAWLYDRALKLDLLPRLLHAQIQLYSTDDPTTHVKELFQIYPELPYYSPYAAIRMTYDKEKKVSAVYAWPPDPGRTAADCRNTR